MRARRQAASGVGRGKQAFRGRFCPIPIELTHGMRVAGALLGEPARKRHFARVRGLPDEAE